MQKSLTSPTVSPSAPADSSPPGYLIWDFAAATFVSAFLLFQVQPIISKYILPWFGGTPAVWTTCLLFFQVILFFGYAYAHLVQTFCTARLQGAIHIGLLVSAVVLSALFLPPAESWKPVDSTDPVGRILSLLACTVGLPYFIISSTGPLLQAWFSRAYEHRSPYRLYALSNIGSMLALLSYPVFFERQFDLPVQARLWIVGYAAFAVLCGMAAVWMYRANPGVPKTAVAALESHEEPVTDRPRWWQPLGWFTLPAIGTLSLMAITNYVCTDVAPVPLLFLAPFTAYLLSFIITFDHQRWYVRGVFGPLVALLAVADVLELRYLGKFPWQDWPRVFAGHMFGLKALLPSPSLPRPVLPIQWEISFYVLLLFAICMVCHGEVVRLRPSSRYLTSFYLSISAGGALGGIFVSLIAPHIFDWYVEFDIARGLAFVLGMGALALSMPPLIRLAWPGSARGGIRIDYLAPVVFVTALVGVTFWRLDFQSQLSKAVYRGRNFFGVVSVKETEEKETLASGEVVITHWHTFKSGGIDHGWQWMDGEKRKLPVSYFSPISGSGHTMVWMQLKHPEGVHVGVIGMGVAVLAAYGRQQDYMRFYEINPQVIEIAKNPKYFTFLDDCQAKYDVIDADGRLALEREPPNKFHILYLDAFTGDAPPPHLLTIEAFDLYKKHLTDDGLIVVNVINSYLNVPPVVERAARERGWPYSRVMLPRNYYGRDASRISADYEGALNRTDFITIAPNNPQFIVDNPDFKPPPENLAPPMDIPLWTDRYTNLFEIFYPKVPEPSPDIMPPDLRKPIPWEPPAAAPKPN